MRIQTLSQRTGISKRNIHYYIKEKLIQPKADAANGYFDFSEHDYQQLMLINNLRKGGFSIAVIKTILQTPASSEYYMRMRLGRIEQEIQRSTCIVSQINTVLKLLPVNPTFADLYEPIVVSEKNMQLRFNIPYDGMLVNHFLWRTFWSEDPLTEYQQFLWQKINNMTDSREKNIHYAALYDYLCSQDHKKIDALYRERNQHFNRVSRFSTEEVPLYADEMKKTVREFIQTPAAVAQWKDHYHSFICPQIKIFTGPIGKLAEEMNPFFRAYKSNSTKACEIIYEWMNTETGNELKQAVQDVLGGFVDLEHCNHAELESMNTIFEYN